jgi:hypothetical protein
MPCAFEGATYEPQPRRVHAAFAQVRCGHHLRPAALQDGGGSGGAAPPAAAAARALSWDASHVCGLRPDGGDHARRLGHRIALAGGQDTVDVQMHLIWRRRESLENVVKPCILSIPQGTT